MIKVSAPHRLDIGGTWDLKPFVLLHSDYEPSTVTIAISLYIHVNAKYYKPNYIRISDNQDSVEYHYKNSVFTKKFSLISAVLSYFNIMNIDITYNYDCPSYSGLGGSSILVLSTIAAVSRLYNKVISPCEMIALTSRIEDGLRYSFAGMQDQCAAMYGGVNHWYWADNSRYRRDNIVTIDGLNYSELDDRLVVAYTGQPHSSDDVNSIQVSSMMDGSRRKEWIRINDITKHFSDAISKQRWTHAIDLINEETRLRSIIAPTRITPLAKCLQEDAVDAGFAPAGSGNGGFIWCLCKNKEHAALIKKRWSSRLLPIANADVYDIEIARDGLCCQRV
jgi:D-glycero-alpha-D-manno-heptose-7-phosphate kinase